MRNLFMILTIFVCFLVSGCSFVTVEKKGVNMEHSLLLPTVTPSVSSEEWKNYITEIFQEYFGNTTPLVKKTYIVLGQVPEIAEVKCFRFINECYLSISVSFLGLLSSRDELVVVLGHEVGHLTNDTLQLMEGASLNPESYLEREIVADTFVTRLVPQGACHLATVLPKIFGLVEKEQGIASSPYAVIVNERIHRLNILCDDELN